MRQFLVLLLAFTVLGVVPVNAQERPATTHYDCRAAKTLSTIHDFVTGSTTDKM